MLPNDEVRRLRRDLDEVMNHTADLSRRLERLEACGEQPVPQADSEEAALPVPVQEPVPAGATLRDAAKRGDVALARRCIEQGADLNEVVDDETALDLAVGAAQFEMVKFLVANGATIEHALRYGKSQIRRARSFGRRDIAEFLEQALCAGSKPASAESPLHASPVTPDTAPVAPVSLWNILAAGPLGRFVRDRIEQIRTQAREIGWEAQLGTYLLPRVAVVCISIAVVFFLSLAIERWGAAWMPYVRVAVGYAVSAGLLLLAWRSEAKYGGLARVLYGGGFAAMYFVTFATYYIRFARVFSSPVPTLLLLAAIVVAWTIVAQFRQSRIIAVLVTGLGHLTVLLSTLTLEVSGPFAMMGLVALSAGSAFFLLRNRWYYVASLGLIGSYVNDVIVSAHSPAGNPHTDFGGSMGVLVIFFLVFALAELFSPEELRRKTVPGWFRNAFVTVNTAAFLLIGTVVVDNFDFTRGHQDLFRIAAAGLLMVIGLGYLRLRAGDPLFNIYFVKSVAIATLALATRYGGDTLSVCLAVEMVVLLFSARRSGLVVMRVLAFGVACLAFVQSLDAAFLTTFGADMSTRIAPMHFAPADYAAPGYLAHVIQAALGVLAFLASSLLYQRTDWSLRAPKTVPFSPGISALCWRLDLIAECPAGLKETDRPFGGLLFPYLYALAGAILFVAYTVPLVHEGHRFIVLAGGALLMTVSAAFLSSRPFGLAAVGLFILAAFPAGIRELSHPETLNRVFVIAGLIMAGAVALASEGSRIGKRAGLAFHQHVVSPYALYGLCAWLTGLFLVKELPGVNGVFALTAAAAVSAALTPVLHAAALAGISGGFMLWANVVYLPAAVHHLHGNSARFDAAACVLVVLSLLLDRYFSSHGKRTKISPYLCAVLTVNAIAVLLCHFEVRIDPEWLVAATALACYGFLVYAAAFRAPVACVVAFAGMVLASLRHMVEVFSAVSLAPGLVTAFGLLTVFCIAAERLFVWWMPRFGGTLDWVKLENGWALKRSENALAPIALATALFIVMLSRVPYLVHSNLAFITIGWFALAAGLFGLAFFFRQRFYRYAALGVILLSLGRLFLIDMKEQDPLLRVAAFAVVGAGLLCISVGYYKWMSRTRSRSEDDEDASR